MKIHAIITAAGTGTRFQEQNKSTSSFPKQFVNLRGKPVILYSLLVLQRCKHIDEILVSTERKYFDLIHKLASDNAISKLTFLAEGGRTRFESVRNVFNQISADSSDLVLIHDAARPNITMRFVNSIIKSAIRFGNVIPGIRMGETVKKVKNSYVLETIDRNDLWMIQTPQIFKFTDLTLSYKKTVRTNYTDESSMVEDAGYKVRIVEGFTGNIKITTRDDLQTLKKLLGK